MEWDIVADTPIDLSIVAGNTVARSATRLLAQESFLTASIKATHKLKLAPRGSEPLGNARVHVAVSRSSWRSLLLKFRILR
jgi:hypothetical protein